MPLPSPASRAAFLAHGPFLALQGQQCSISKSLCWVFSWPSLPCSHSCSTTFLQGLASARTIHQIVQDSPLFSRSLITYAKAALQGVIHRLQELGAGSLREPLVSFPQGAIPSSLAFYHVIHRTCLHEASSPYITKLPNSSGTLCDSQCIMGKGQWMRSEKCI